MQGEVLLWALGEVDTTQNVSPSKLGPAAAAPPLPITCPGLNPAHPGPAVCFEGCVSAIFGMIEEQLQGEVCEYARTRTHELIKQNKIQDWSVPAP